MKTTAAALNGAPTVKKSWEEKTMADSKKAETAAALKTAKADATAKKTKYDGLNTKVTDALGKID